jgi:hypothetical protein
MKKIFIGILVVLCLIVIGLIIGTMSKYKDKPREENNSNIKFDIVTSPTDLTCGGTASYSYKEVDDDTLIRICRGQKNTGGYQLEVKKVTYKDDTIYVYVLDSDPGKGDTVTMALTYPSVTIKVPRKGKSIVIKGNENYKEYKKEQSYEVNPK